MDDVAAAATNFGDDCKECNECEDMTECIKSLRRAVGYLAECVARLIESNKRVNEMLLNYIKKDIKEKGEKDFAGFYV